MCGFRTEFAAPYQPDPAEDAATAAAAAFDLKPYLDHSPEFFTYLSNGETPLRLKCLGQPNKCPLSTSQRASPHRPPDDPQA